MLKYTVAVAALFAGTAQAQEFPLTIEHKFGTTVIEAKPERVASVDYAGVDDLLAMGVQPVTIRYWYGENEQGVWPWAEDLLTTDPEILKGDLDYEQISRAEPDVILAVWSGISEEDYEKLSQIAPVVAVPDGMGDYAMPWDERAMTAGRAIGLEDTAEELVGSINAQLAKIAADHPQWDGKTASIAAYWGSGPGVYSSLDVRAQVLGAMGFVTPPAIDEAAAGEFWLSIGDESLPIIDADLLIWLENGTRDDIEGMPTRPFLNAYKEGHELFFDSAITGAFSYSSLLSLPYALDYMVPEIEKALD